MKMTPVEKEALRILKAETRQVGCVLRKYTPEARRINAAVHLVKQGHMGRRDVLHKVYDMIREHDWDSQSLMAKDGASLT